MNMKQNTIRLIVCFAAEIFVLFAAFVLLSGCKAIDTLAEGVSRKSVSGSGAFLYNRVGLDTTTQTPELAAIFVWGDYSSVAEGDELFRYEESSDASVFNANAVSTKKKLFFATSDKERMDQVIRKMTGKPEEPEGEK